MSTLLGKIAADFETTLATKVAIGGTGATLQSNIDDDGNALPNGAYFLTVDADNSQKEYFFCQITGTAVSSIQSVSRQGVLSTGTLRVHRVGASVSITDFANLKIITDYLTGVKQLDSTVPLGYDGTPSSLTGNQLATVAYVLSVVTGGTVAFSQQSLGTQILGETVALSAIVYLKSSDQRWYNANSAISSTYNGVQLGICLTAGVAGGGTSIALSGPVSNFTSLTAGSAYYLNGNGAVSLTAGGLNSIFIGYALTTTSILFSPSIKNTSVVYSLTGMVSPYAGSSAPVGWILCDGSAVSRTTYAGLFALISTTYGVGDGSTTFNVPNLLGKVPVGMDASETEFATLGLTGGEKTHLLSSTEMPAHTHSITLTSTGGTGGGLGFQNGNGNSLAATGNTGSTGGGTAHNNLQPYISLNYIIKT